MTKNIRDQIQTYPADACDYAAVAETIHNNISSPTLSPSIKDLITSFRSKYDGNPEAYESLRQTAIDILLAIKSEIKSRQEARK